MPRQARNEPIRVLIVEDSPLQSLLLKRLLEAQPDLQVVGIARDGQEALRLTSELGPDIITMDVQMPLMDGLEATRAIMDCCPRPILVVADLTNAHTIGAQEMLGAGALDVFAKPAGLDGWYAAGDELAGRVRALACVRLSARPVSPSPATAVQREVPAGWGRPRVVAIAASSGGPPALRRILRPLPKEYGVPIIVVQHIAPGFGVGLVQWLRSVCALPVRLAEDQTHIEQPGVAIAPDDQHVTVGRNGRLSLSATAPVESLRPRADLLLDSLARAYGRFAVGIVLTGMGSDGARGLQAMRRAGALTIAQDEASSVVYGMPKAALELGASVLVLSLDEIAAFLLRCADAPPTARAEASA